MQASYPAIGTAKKSLLEALTEVHLRRLDTNDTLHRRAVAVIAIEASLEEVLTSCLRFDGVETCTSQTRRFQATPVVPHEM